MAKSSKEKYQPIENYGIIGDLRTVALVGLNGSIDFMCFPDFDSPTVFGAMLDYKKGGKFEAETLQENVKNKQMYIPSTNVLLTRYLFDQGIGEIIDFMPISERFKKNILIRRFSSIKGEIPFRIRCAPRFNYGESKHKTYLKDNEIFFESQGKDRLVLRLKSTVPLKVKSGDGFAEFVLQPNQKADFILENYHPDEVEHLPNIQNFVEYALEETIGYWQKWVSQSNYHGRWREMVDRSALVLKLLISCKYGSIIAAPTFGLPEVIGGTLNWDYRYTWLRDAAFTTYALMRLGYKSEADAFINWFSNVCEKVGKSGNLNIMYRINGKTNLKESILNNLEGYKKSEPVRIGNAAYNQLQLDVYGELIDAIYIYDKFINPISNETWQFLIEQIDWVSTHWQIKGHGIWEERRQKKEFLYSALMCWVAIDRAIRLAVRRSLPYPARWCKTRDTIYKSIFADFWNEKLQTFVSIKNGSRVDASTLMMPLIRFISPKDPKWLSTLKRIEEELVVDALVYRYKTTLKEGEAGEGTFSLCSFLYAECLSRSGHIRKARFNFEKMLSYANHLGLYSEQLGFKGEHLGNFPQAFTHLALISAAFDLNKRLEHGD